MSGSASFQRAIGRAELFERDRHREPVPRWHSCTIAGAEAN